MQPLSCGINSLEYLANIPNLIDSRLVHSSEHCHRVNTKEWCHWSSYHLDSETLSLFTTQELCTVAPWYNFFALFLYHCFEVKKKINKNIMKGKDKMMKECTWAVCLEFTWACHRFMVINWFVLNLWFKTCKYEAAKAT